MSNRIEIIKRDDSDFEVTIVDSDGVAVDLTGGTVFFTAKKRKTDTDDNAVISKDITEFADLDTGKCILRLNKDDTDIVPGSYYFDIQFKNATNQVASTAAGIMLVKQDITIRTE